MGKFSSFAFVLWTVYLSIILFPTISEQLTLLKSIEYPGLPIKWYVFLIIILLPIYYYFHFIAVDLYRYQRMNLLSTLLIFIYLIYLIIISIEMVIKGGSVYGYTTPLLFIAFMNGSSTASSFGGDHFEISTSNNVYKKKGKGFITTFLSQIGGLSIFTGISLSFDITLPNIPFIDIDYSIIRYFLINMIDLLPSWAFFWIPDEFPLPLFLLFFMFVLSSISTVATGFIKAEDDPLDEKIYGFIGVYLIYGAIIVIIFYFIGLMVKIHLGYPIIRNQFEILVLFHWTLGFYMIVFSEFVGIFFKGIYESYEDL